MELLKSKDMHGFNALGAFFFFFGQIPFVKSCSNFYSHLLPPT